MTIRHVSGAVAAALLTAGLLALAPAKGLAQEQIVLPEQGGPITLVGCFLRMKVADGDKFVLVNPTHGPVASVPEGTCTASGMEPMVELDDVHKNPHVHHLDRSKVGRWIQITGRLEKMGHQDLREVHVETYKIVPVVRYAEAPRIVAPPMKLRAPLPAVPVQAVPGPVPVPTTGVAELPQTASSLPLIGLIGAVALAAGLAVRAISPRRTL